MPSFTALRYEKTFRTSPARLWAALTDGGQTPAYYFGTRLVAELRPGGRFDYLQPDGTAMITGQVLAIEPGTMVETTFEPRWLPDASDSTVRFEVSGEAGAATLVVEHRQLATSLAAGMDGGWKKILRGLGRVVAPAPAPRRPRA